MSKEPKIVDENFHNNLEAERKKNKPKATQLENPSVRIELNEICKAEEIPERFHIDVGTAHFECFFKEKKEDWLYVFLSSANFNQMKLPRFQRWSWYPLIKGNVLYVEDPMYYTYPNLKIGWFIGTEDENYSEYLSNIVKEIAKKYNISNEHIMFYGSSAGGSAAINCARYIQGSLSSSLGPQIYSFSPKHKDNFEESTNMKIKDLCVRDRLDFTSSFYNGESKHILIINCAAKSDFANLLKWCDGQGLRLVRGLNSKDNVVIWVYEAYGLPAGHGSFEDSSMFQAIDNLMRLISDCKTNEDMKRVVNEQRWLYSLFTDFWYDRYVSLKNFEMKQIEKSLKDYEVENQKKACIRCEEFILQADCDRSSKLLADAIYSKDELKNVVRGETIGIIARMYRDGRNVSKDASRAIGYMRVAAEKNIKWAKNELVDMLIKRASNNDLEEAFNICSKFAEEGEVGAMGRLGRMYRDGKGATQNMDEAVKWMRRAADNNVGWAKNELVDILIKRASNKDLKEALNICSKFVEEGDIGAMGRLSRMYRDGKGVRKDLNKALELMKQVAGASPHWINEYADMLLKTSDENNWRVAFEICRSISDFNSGAMRHLSRMYRDGKGVAKDLNESKKWMARADERIPE